MQVEAWKQDDADAPLVFSCSRSGSGPIIRVLLFMVAHTRLLLFLCNVLGSLFLSITFGTLATLIWLSVCA